MNGEADWSNPLYVIANAIALSLVPLTVVYIAARVGKVPIRRLLDRHFELLEAGINLTRVRLFDVVLWEEYQYPRH